MRCDFVIAADMIVLEYIWDRYRALLLCLFYTHESCVSYGLLCLSVNPSLLRESFKITASGSFKMYPGMLKVFFWPYDSKTVGFLKLRTWMFLVRHSYVPPDLNSIWKYRKCQLSAKHVRHYRVKTKECRNCFYIHMKMKEVLVWKIVEINKEKQNCRQQHENTLLTLSALLQSWRKKPKWQLG